MDTTIYKGPDFSNTQKFSVKVYFKDTDTHALLHKTSFHPTHTFKGLVQSQLTRFKRICTNREDFKIAVQLLFGSLRKRGYSRSFLRRCLKTFETPKQKLQKEAIPLIMKFSTISTKLNTIFKNNYRRIVYEQGLLPNHHVISAYRRNPNLKDYLVRAKLPSLKPTSKPNAMTGVFKKREFVKNQRTNMVFKIQQGFSPRTTNVVYLIYCSVCKIQYVGETRNSMALRMTQHRYNITNQKNTKTPLVRHFIRHGLQAVRMAGLQSYSIWTDTERKSRERIWIKQLDTMEPHGLNLKYN